MTEPSIGKHPYRELAKLSAEAKTSKKKVPLGLLLRARTVLRRSLDSGYLVTIDRIDAADFVDSIAELSDIALDAIALVKRSSYGGSASMLIVALGVLKWLNGAPAHALGGALVGVIFIEAVMLAIMSRAQNVVEQVRELIEQSRAEIRKMPVPNEIVERVRAELASEALPQGVDSEPAAEEKRTTRR